MWSLADFGLRCVIAPSFGDIFYANCFQNGMLPIRLPKPEVERIAAEIESADEPPLTVDLEAQTVRSPSGATVAFEIDAERRQGLLEGLDEIGMTLKLDRAHPRIPAPRPHRATVDLSARGERERGACVDLGRRRHRPGSPRRGEAGRRVVSRQARRRDGPARGAVRHLGVEDARHADARGDLGRDPGRRRDPVRRHRLARIRQDPLRGAQAGPAAAHPQGTRPVLQPAPGAHP